MASAVYNNGKYRIANQNVNWGSAVIRVMLVGTGYTFNADHNFVSQVTNEIAGTGYSRKTLTGCTITKDDTNDRVVFDAADVSYANLDPDVGTIAAAVVYVQVGGDDTTPADDILIAYMDYADLVCNGSPVDLVWSANGLFYF